MPPDVARERAPAGSEVQQGAVATRSGGVRVSAVEQPVVDDDRVPGPEPQGDLAGVVTHGGVRRRGGIGFMLVGLREDGVQWRA
jgi:hypothetical protein